MEEVKLKIIDDFKKFLNRQELGYIDDYQHIILKILLVESSEIDTRLREFLINN